MPGAPESTGGASDPVAPGRRLLSGPWLNLLGGTLAGIGTGSLLAGAVLLFTWLQQGRSGNSLAGFFWLLALPFIMAGAGFAALGISHRRTAAEDGVTGWPSTVTFAGLAVVCSLLTFGLIAYWLEFNTLPSITGY